MVVAIIEFFWKVLVSLRGSETVKYQSKPQKKTHQNFLEKLNYRGHGVCACSIASWPLILALQAKNFFLCIL